MLAGGEGRLEFLCECCLSIVGQPPTRAVYRWIGPSGNISNLCVSCCASWRANARDDPSLAPQRIETLPEIPVSNIQWELR